MYVQVNFLLFVEWTQVGGKSLVLVLHTIPLSLGNGAKQALQTVAAGWLATKGVVRNVLCDIIEILYEQQRNIRNLFQGLPGEAYFGFLLLFLLLLVRIGTSLAC